MMGGYIFDSHAHYDDDKFDGERDRIIAEELSDVKYVMDVGWHGSVMLAEKYDKFYASVGVHPHEVGKITEDICPKLESMLRHKKVLALGEIGLDFYYNFSDRETQMYWFERQMELAAELNVPVIIHDREAHGPCLEMVKKFPKLKGIFHSYSGSAEMAAELVKRGWYISFNGIVTFKNAVNLREVVKYVPLERLLIETDCPYLAPHPMRGKLNHSGYLKYTAEAIAELKNIEFEELCYVTCRNACEIYGVNL